MKAGVPTPGHRSGSVVRVGLISDTHGSLRPRVFEYFESVDHIVHAGDVGSADLLAELEAIAPVTAVWGNTDGFDMRDRFPETARIHLAGRTIAVSHGHTFPVLAPPQLLEAFPDAGVVVYGHTHRPLVTRVGSRLTVNPGAAGPARFGLRPSIAILTLHRAGEDVRLIEL